MKRLFQVMLRLYPKSFRSRFSREMLTTFEDLRREKANCRSIWQIVFLLREIGGLLRGVCAEQFRFAVGSRQNLPVAVGAESGVNDGSNRSEIAELEERVRFHLSQTVDCIANHRFEGARIHAAEEDRARARLLVLQASIHRQANEG
jgi:hypothetical protein